MRDTPAEGFLTQASIETHGAYNVLTLRLSNTRNPSTVLQDTRQR